MAYTTTIRIKNDNFNFATKVANKYHLSRSTVINIAIAKLSKSKFKDRFVKMGINRNTKANKTKTTWSTSTGIYNYINLRKKTYNCSISDIILAALIYIEINSKHEKYLDRVYSTIIERNKNIYKRKVLI